MEALIKMVTFKNNLILDILNSTFFCFNNRFNVDENHGFTLSGNAQQIQFYLME